MVPGGGHAALLARHANEVPGAECWSSLVRKILPQIRTDPIEPGESSVFVTLPPPLALGNCFSAPAVGRIFPLSSRVMRVGLNTGCGAERLKNGSLRADILWT